MAANSRQMESSIERLVYQHFLGSRVVQSEVSERKTEEIWRVREYDDRQLYRSGG